MSTLLREIPGNIAWYGVYESISKFQARNLEEGKFGLTFYHHLIAGGFSGAAYWSAFYPADTVKSKIQTDPKLKNAKFLDVFQVL